MLVEQTLFELINKPQSAIDLLKQYEPPEGYQVNFSGGKDSVVLLDLVKKSRVKCDIIYQNTTCDPPELYRFVKTFPEVHIIHPKRTMWELVRTNGLPTRIMRWCCRYLKEISGDGRVLVNGIRAEESHRRARRNVIDMPTGNRKIKFFVNPILHWTIVDIWDYIDNNNLAYCSLYDEYWDRLGCVVCPMQTVRKRIISMERWPKYWEAMERAGRRWFDNKNRQIDGDPLYDSWERFWHHWLYEDKYPNYRQSSLAFSEKMNKEDE